MKRTYLFGGACILILHCTITAMAATLHPSLSHYTVERIDTNSFPGLIDRANNADGSWQQDENGWWWQYPDGSYAVDQWEYIGNRWYFFNGDGYMAVGWQNINSEWFYLEENGNSSFPQGAMVTGWYEIGNYWYYFYSTAQFEHSAGAMAKGWLHLDGNAYYLYQVETGDNPMGSMATGWVTINTEIFHFDEETGRLDSGETITVAVDVYTDTTFRSEFSDSIGVDELFGLVNIPYEKTWNILFALEEYQSDGLDIDRCPTAPREPCDCADESKCTNSPSSPYHHKNAEKLLAELKDIYPSTRNLKIGLSGSRVMCWNNDGEHGAVYGLTYYRGWHSYCAANASDIKHTIRIIQHEMSHLYGTDDKECPGPCTMHGDFDLLPLHCEDVWCSRCKGVFERGYHEGI